MKLSQLRFLIAVYEERSFTAAARRVHATQSGLSMQIKDLELQLGVKLFERGSTGVVPTGVGEQLYRRATRIMREVSAIGNDVEAVSGEVTGTVNVGVMPTFARAVLAPVLERFDIQHSQINVRVIEAYSAVLSSAVAGGEMDFAIVPSSRDMSGVRGTHIDRDVEVFVSGPDSPWDHLAPVDLSRCDPLKLALPEPANGRRGKIDNYIATYNVPTKAIMELDSMMGTMDLVARSDWTTILPGCLSFPDLDGQARKLHPIINPPLMVDYILIEPISQTTSAAAQLFAGDLLKQIQETCAFCRERLGPDAANGGVAEGLAAAGAG